MREPVAGRGGRRPPRGRGTQPRGRPPPPPQSGSTWSAARPRGHHARQRSRRYSLNRLVMSDAYPRPSLVDLRNQMDEITRLRREMSAKAPDQRRTTTRAVARILEDVHLEGRMGKFVVECDEPLARGGTEQGPSPLQYLMMGTAF